MMSHTFRRGRGLEYDVRSEVAGPLLTILELGESCGRQKSPDSFLRPRP